MTKAHELTVALIPAPQSPTGLGRTAVRRAAPRSGPLSSNGGVRSVQVEGDWLRGVRGTSDGTEADRVDGQVDVQAGRPMVTAAQHCCHHIRRDAGRHIDQRTTLGVRIAEFLDCPLLSIGHRYLAVETNFSDTAFHSHRYHPQSHRSIYYRSFLETRRFISTPVPGVP
jgi:hypothetical protein